MDNSFLFWIYDFLNEKKKIKINKRKGKETTAFRGNIEIII